MKFKKILILITVWTLYTPQHAVTSINSVSRFYKTIASKDLVIAHFYIKPPKE